MIQFLFLFAYLTISQQAYIIDSAVDQIFWCGSSIIVTSDDDVVQQQNEAQQHRKILFVLSNKGIVYRSTDYGVKWENVTQNLIGEKQLDQGYKFKDVLQSPADSHTMYFIGLNQSFISQDCGKTYKPFNDNKLYGFRFNKLEKNQILAFQEKKCNKTEKNCKEQYKRELWVTSDGATTWISVLDHVRDAAWDKLIHYEMVPDMRIIASHVDKDGELKVSYSDDFFKTIRPIEKDCFGFYQTPTYLFLLVRPDQYSVGYDLKMSPHLGDTYFPQEIVLPIDDQSKHTFTVLDVTDSIVYMSVAHTEELSKVTNIYMSDGNEFTISLLGNVRSQDTGHCDFEKIKSMTGIYIANIFDNEEIERTKSRRKRINSEREMKNQNTDRLDQYKKSVITYDFGAEWHPIKAPKYSYLGQPLNCNGDCSLHLRGRTETTSLIYSSDQAVGIIIGTGNTGMYLDSQETFTYISRDGGQNWYEIANGTYIYEIGDHGGIILLAESESLTDVAKYTLDEGLTIQEIKLNITLDIDNIVTEPSNEEQKFLIYGRIKQADHPEEDFWNKYESILGVLVPVDLSQVYPRICKGAENPGEVNSDYEYWSPVNYQQQKCLFGQKVKYQRKKREAKCKNPDIVKKVLVESCPCTKEDWECDLGYMRKIDGGDCVPMTLGFNTLPPPVKCVGTYMRSQGYRKIPGDQCQEGIYLGPIETDCPVEKANIQVNQVNNDKIEKEEIIKKQVIPKEQEFNLSDYADYIVIILVILVLLIFRNQILGIAKLFFQSSQVNRSILNSLLERKNYYPPTEEEMQEKTKTTKKRLFGIQSTKDEDEEAGL